jgi:hypothetical protein
MPTILKIGYSEFVVRNPADAAKVISVMSSAVAVNKCYRDGEYWYYPEARDNTEIGMRSVAPRNLLMRKPAEDEPLPEDEPIITPAPRKPRKLTMG